MRVLSLSELEAQLNELLPDKRSLIQKINDTLLEDVSGARHVYNRNRGLYVSSSVFNHVTLEQLRRLMPSYDVNETSDRDGHAFIIKAK